MYTTQHDMSSMPTEIANTWMALQAVKAGRAEHLNLQTDSGPEASQAAVSALLYQTTEVRTTVGLS